MNIKHIFFQRILWTFYLESSLMNWSKQYITIKAVIQNSHSQSFDRRWSACAVRSKEALEHFLDEDISTSIKQYFIFSLKIYSTPLSRFLPKFASFYHLQASFVVTILMRSITNVLYCCQPSIVTCN